MTSAKILNAKILKLKKQSRTKWQRIVKDLCSDRPKLKVTLDCAGCGYCLIQDIKDGVIEDDPACDKCCLADKSLCNSGRGDAIKAVVGYYYREKGGNRIAALKDAAAILVAIERDIEKENITC